jgi:hypothetical protein
MIAASGLIMLYRILRQEESAAAEQYLKRSAKLLQDILKMSGTPLANRSGRGHCNFGAEGWETLFKVRDQTGSPQHTR